MKHERLFDPSYEHFGTYTEPCPECGGRLRLRRTCIGCTILDKSLYYQNDDQKCWTWWGAIRNHYGVIRCESETHRYKVRPVNRVAFATWRGPLTAFPFVNVMSACGDKRCARPDHLRLARDELFQPYDAPIIRPGGKRVWGDNYLRGMKWTTSTAP
jgi:hypothetical protein